MRALNTAIPTTDTATPSATRNAPDVASLTPRSRASDRTVHAISTPAEGTRLGRVAIAALVARPALSGRRDTVSTSASVQAAVTGTSLIAFIS
jgi:hypothetical protein